MILPYILAMIHEHVLSFLCGTSSPTALIAANRTSVCFFMEFIFFSKTLNPHGPIANMLHSIPLPPFYLIYILFFYIRSF
jgi:hypothetical protein